ncbi:MAG: VanZ family protein [Clostridiales bacterium]|nr:VanZ family protein [Clostridiales bacterium]
MKWLSRARAGKKKLKTILSWIAVAAWMAVIFWFSSDNAAASAQKSNAVLAIITDFFSDAQAATDLFGEGFLVRKAAHFSEYFALGLLVANAWLRSPWPRLLSLRPRSSRSRSVSRSMRRALLFCVAFCALYAITDEFHQLFVPGRVASIIDVGVDALGALPGAAIMSALFLWRKRS